MRSDVGPSKCCFPHLSDDDLFSLEHIFADRSKEPIKAFLTALLERDTARTASWLQQQKPFEEKAATAMAELTPLFAAHFSSDVALELMTAVFQSISTSRPVWERWEFLNALARQYKDDVQVWQIIREAATKDADSHVRRRACALLIESLNCSELQRKLMARNRQYWDYFAHDLKRPIKSARVTAAAKRLNLSEDEVRRQYEAIANQLPVELILEWRKGH